MEVSGDDLVRTRHCKIPDCLDDAVDAAGRWAGLCKVHRASAIAKMISDPEHGARISVGQRGNYAAKNALAHSSDMGALVTAARTAEALATSAAAAVRRAHEVVAAERAEVIATRRARAAVCKALELRDQAFAAHRRLHELAVDLAKMTSSDAS